MDLLRHQGKFALDHSLLVFATSTNLNSGKMAAEDRTAGAVGPDDGNGTGMPSLSKSKTPTSRKYRSQTHKPTSQTPRRRPLLCRQSTTPTATKS